MAPNPKGNPKLPDAWQRFERAVDAAVKSGPKPKTPKKKGKPKPFRKRASSRAKP